MPEEKNCKLLQLDPSAERKRRRRKTKKTAAATWTAEHTERPVAPAPPRGHLPKLGKKSVERPAGSGRASRKPPKRSPGPQRAESRRGADGRGEAPGAASEPCAPAGESLRWEGALQDPQAEAERLERYRASRRLRYIAHREALLRQLVRPGGGGGGGGGGAGAASEARLKHRDGGSSA